MAYFEFPHTRNYDGDLGWVIKKLTEVANITAYLQEEFAKIVVLTEDQIDAMITAAINANNVVWAQELQTLKAQITLEYKGYVTAQINALTTYIDNQDVYYNGLAENYASTALADAKDYTDSQVLSYTMMINPITGEYDDVREVVEDIIIYFHSADSLTAAEYDALDLQADYYDNKQLTAYDYDFNGKNLLP